MALGASVYKLVFDTDGLESVTASRRELALQKKIMEETTPAVDKLAQAEANLDRLVAKDLISVEQRNQALAKVRDELTGSEADVKTFTAAHLDGIPVVGKFASTLSAVGPIGIGVAAAVGQVAIAGKLMGAAFDFASDKVAEQIEKIDAMSNAADNIGIAVDQYQRLAHAADHADIEQEKFASGMEKMLVGISKGADGSKKFVEAFGLIGLDARKLSDMQPDKAFRTITEALDKVPNSADKARAATAIFGDADFLRINTEHIDRANSLMEKLGGTLDDTDMGVFGEFDANVKDMNTALDVTFQKLAIEIVPALGDAAAVATDWLVTLNQNETFTDTLKDIGDSLIVITAIAKEMPSTIDKWTPAIETAASTLKSAFPSVAGFEAAGFIAGRTTKSAGESDIATEVRRQQELDAKLKAAQDSGKPIAADDGEADASDKETDSIQKLIDKLKEEVATKGMSAAMAKVWKLEQLGAGEEVLLQNQLLAEEYDRLENAEKSARAVEAFTESLRHQGESAAESARRLADLKLKNEGVDEATRKSLMAQYDASEAQKLAAAEAKKHSDALTTMGDNLEKQEAKLNGFNDATGKHEDRVRAGERAVLAWQLAHDKADASTTAATLGHFDAITALEKRQRATEAATKAEDDLRKLIRQGSMTAQEKQLDDLKESGVNDEQVKLIANLQKEAAIRGLIKQELTATSGVIKANSREAADAFARANQASVRASFVRSQVPTDSTLADKARAKLNDNLNNDNLNSDRITGQTATPSSARPVVSATTASPQAAIANQAKEQLQEMKTHTAILTKIEEKTVPLVIEEVTL